MASEDPRSPATALLHDAGVPVATLAERLGVSASTASRYLRGSCSPPSNLPAVLAALVGERKAREIVRLIPDRPGRRRAVRVVAAGAGLPPTKRRGQPSGRPPITNAAR